MHVEATSDSSKAGATTVQAYLARQKKTAEAGLSVPIRISAQETGPLGVNKMRETINAALAKDGGVAVPIKISINAQQAATLRKDISTAIGVVDIYFNWVAKNRPEDPGGGTRTRGGGGRAERGRGRGWRRRWR